LVLAELDRVNILNESLQGMLGLSKSILDLRDSIKNVFGFLIAEVKKIPSNVTLLLLDLSN